VSETSFVEDALRSTAAELFGGGDRLVTVSRLLDLGWNDLAADDLGTAVSVLAELAHNDVALTVVALAAGAVSGMAAHFLCRQKKRSISTDNRRRFYKESN